MLKVTYSDLHFAISSGVTLLMMLSSFEEAAIDAELQKRNDLL